MIIFYGVRRSLSFLCSFLASITVREKRPVGVSSLPCVMARQGSEKIPAGLFYCPRQTPMLKKMELSFFLMGAFFFSLLFQVACFFSVSF